MGPPVAVPYDHSQRRRQEEQEQEQGQDEREQCHEHLKRQRGLHVVAAHQAALADVGPRLHLRAAGSGGTARGRGGEV